MCYATAANLLQLYFKWNSNYCIKFSGTFIWKLTRLLFVMICLWLEHHPCQICLCILQQCPEYKWSFLSWRGSDYLPVMVISALALKSFWVHLLGRHLWEVVAAPMWTGVAYNDIHSQIPAVIIALWMQPWFYYGIQWGQN